MEASQKRSTSLGDIGKYRTDFIEEKMMKETPLQLYLDYIRNYRELSPELLVKLSSLSDNDKLTLLREYNRCIAAIRNLI